MDGCWGDAALSLIFWATSPHLTYPFLIGLPRLIRLGDSSFVSSYFPSWWTVRPRIKIFSPPAPQFPPIRRRPSRPDPFRSGGPPPSWDSRPTPSSSSEENKKCPKRPPSEKAQKSRKSVENEPKTREKKLKKVIFDSSSSFFLTPGPRGSGNPFSDFFRSFLGEAFSTPEEGQ